MRTISVLTWLLALAVLPVHAANADLTDTVPRVLPSVVHIAMGNPRPGRDPSVGDAPTADALVSPAHRGSRMSGSGVIIGEDGYILTVAYLFETQDRIQVRLSDGREMPATLVGRDRRSAVALLKIDATGLSPAKIGDPGKLRLAERVFAIGALPSGLSATVTDGIVSVMSPREKDLAGFIQTTAPLYPAMGGGGLFNQNGEVVGISAMIYSRSSGQGLSFAIPIDEALKVAAELRTKGRVQRGSLGIVIQEVTADQAQSLGLPRPSGALVASVGTGTPAARAGIVPGDLILRIAGQEVGSPGDLVRVVAALKPGARVPVEVRRGKSAKPLKVDVEVADAGD